MVSFGTGGFRGIIGDDFNKENLKKIAQGLANHIHSVGSTKPVYVGYDYRFASDEAAIWIANTLAANGIKVLLSDSPTPTPTTMYASQRDHTDFGVMITASHNPYWYNGVKLFEADGMDAEVELTDALTKEIAGVNEYKTMDFNLAKKEGKITLVDILNPYLKNITRFLVPNEGEKKIHLLLDPIHGTGAITLKKMCQEVGISNVDIINESHDAFFGHKMPNPLPINMKEDAISVVKNHYDLCIGTDSDCDRIAIIDEKGNYVDANEIMGVIYYYLIKYRGEKGDIVKNLASSNLLDQLADKLGYKCHEVDVGFKNVSAGIKKYDALLGGESSGGLTIRGYIFGKDSTFASAMFLEVVGALNKPVSEIIQEVRDYASFHKTNFEDSVGYKNYNKAFSYCGKHVPSFPIAPQEVKPITNNYKYYFPNGDWALLRFSGTEPLCRVFCESADKEFATKSLKAIKDLVIQSEQ
jgi:phosphomannomutase